MSNKNIAFSAMREVLTTLYEDMAQDHPQKANVARALALAKKVDKERKELSQRTKAAMRRAKKEGVQIGRKPIDVDLDEVLRLQEQGFGLRAIAEKMGVAVNTIQRARGVLGPRTKN